MTILKKCWCCISLRKGSFMSGFYSLGLYTFVVAGGIILLHTESSTEGETILTSLMVMFAGICVITSILLLVGLCVESRALMLPWMFSVTLTTILHLITSFYLFGEWQHEFTLILFFADICICALNTYSIICVISRYQECYTESQRTANRVRRPVYDEPNKPVKKDDSVCVVDSESTSTTVLSGPALVLPKKFAIKEDSSSTSEQRIETESTSTSANPSDVEENGSENTKRHFYHSVVRLEKVCKLNWKTFGRTKSTKTFLAFNSDNQTED